ncbi:MAG: DUF4845 domain-containing protein [Gallionella sp.]|nr:DUF4845 domain-containing protein [Gallionella sp.]
MNTTKFDRQRGLGFSGFIQGAFILVLLSVLGLKLLPVYMQNGEIKQLFTTIVHDPEMQKASLRDIRNSYSRRASIDNITAIEPEDIDIDREGDKMILSASYAVKIPLAGNMSLYLDFNPSSADN